MPPNPVTASLFTSVSIQELRRRMREREQARAMQ
jgi:hypothetical protein